MPHGNPPFSGMISRVIPDIHFFLIFYGLMCSLMLSRTLITNMKVVNWKYDFFRYRRTIESPLFCVLGAFLTTYCLVEPVWVGWWPSIFHIRYNRPLDIVWRRKHLSTTYKWPTILIFLRRCICLCRLSTICSRVRSTVITWGLTRRLQVSASADLCTGAGRHDIPPTWAHDTRTLHTVL